MRHFFKKMYLVSKENDDEQICNRCGTLLHFECIVDCVRCGGICDSCWSCLCEEDGDASLDWQRQCDECDSEHDHGPCPPETDSFEVSTDDDALNRNLSGSVSPLSSSTDETMGCFCKNTEESCLSICCDKCNLWSHGECYQITPDNVPEKFYCRNCSSESSRLQVPSKAQWIIPAPPHLPSSEILRHVRPQTPISAAPIASPTVNVNRRNEVAAEIGVNPQFRHRRVVMETSWEDGNSSNSNTSSLSISGGGKSISGAKFSATARDKKSSASASGSGERKPFQSLQNKQTDS